MRGWMGSWMEAWMRYRLALHNPPLNSYPTSVPTFNPSSPTPIFCLNSHSISLSHSPFHTSLPTCVINPFVADNLKIIGVAFDRSIVHLVSSTPRHCNMWSKCDSACAGDDCHTGPASGCKVSGGKVSCVKVAYNPEHMNIKQATQNGQLERCKELMESKVWDINAKDDEGCCLLHWAALGNFTEIVR
jgi:hypothetical protein